MAMFSLILRTMVMLSLLSHSTTNQPRSQNKYSGTMMVMTDSHKSGAPSGVTTAELSAARRLTSGRSRKRGSSITIYVKTDVSPERSSGQWTKPTIERTDRIETTHQSAIVEGDDWTVPRRERVDREDLTIERSESGGRDNWIVTRGGLVGDVDNIIQQTESVGRDDWTTLRTESVGRDDWIVGGTSQQAEQAEDDGSIHIGVTKQTEQREQAGYNENISIGEIAQTSQREQAEDDGRITLGETTKYIPQTEQPDDDGNISPGESKHVSQTTQAEDIGNISLGETKHISQTEQAEDDGNSNIGETNQSSHAEQAEDDGNINIGETSKNSHLISSGIQTHAVSNTKLIPIQPPKRTSTTQIYTTGPCNVSNSCGKYTIKATCGCDADCLIHGDCCLDYFSTCLQIGTPDNIADLITRGFMHIDGDNYGIDHFESKMWFNKHSIVHKIKLNEGKKSVAMIVHCYQTTNVSYWTRSLCELPNLSDHFNVLASLVEIPHITFKNIYCGMCNGFDRDKLVWWDKTARCPGSSVMNRAVLMEEYDQCTIKYSYMGMHDVDRIAQSRLSKTLFDYPCHGHKSKLHDTMDTNNDILCTLFDAAGQFYCKISGFHKIKNPYCAACLEECKPMKFMMCPTCGTDICPTCRTLPGIDILFNFDMVDVVGTDNDNKNNAICTNNQVLFSGTNECVQSQCSGSNVNNCQDDVGFKNKTGQIYSIPNDRYYLKYFTTHPIEMLLNMYSTDWRVGHYFSHLNSQFEKLDMLSDTNRTQMDYYERLDCDNNERGAVRFINYNKTFTVATEKPANRINIGSFKPLLIFPEFGHKQCDDSHNLAFNKSFLPEINLMKVSFRSENLVQVRNLLTKSFPSDIIPGDLTIVLSNTDERPLQCASGEKTLLCSPEFVQQNQSMYLYIDGSIFASLDHIPFEEVLFSTHDVHCKTLTLVCLHYPVDLGCDMVTLKGDISVNNNTTVILNGTELDMSGSVFTVSDDILYICAANLTGNRTVSTWGDIGSLSQSVRAVISNVLLGFSIFSLLVTIIVYLSCKSLLNLPGKCIVAFSSCLMLAQILLFFTTTQHREMCYAIAVALHWCLLASFSWVAVISFDFKRTFVDSKPTGNPSKTFVRYLVIAFSLPTIIIVSCVLVDTFRPHGFYIGYGGGGLCWISVPMATVYTFGLPVLLMLMYDAVCFVWIVVSIEKQTHQAVATLGRKRDKSRVFAYVRIASIMGLTWVFGFLSAFTGNETIGYLYVITNSSQGMFVCVSFILQRRVYKQIVKTFRCRNHTDMSRTESRDIYSLS